ncbi:MAG: hypothetical protein CBC64_005805 [Gammaproteobacteria bacterium TMED104]|nr:MAG: hypothetical protein CBC64_005805 [Gammaproteobacteria bacterium TMED104]|tara:strand:- start:30061 stop:30312 length:252 start_codon:yes stop_codon:yes gene_type:complete
MKATRKFYIRVRADYVGYYEIEAKDLNEAEIKAMVQLDHDMNDRVYPDVDCDEYDPTEFMENSDKYQSIQSDNQDYFSQEEEL